MKKILVMTLSVALLLSLTACASQTASPEISNSGANQTEATESLKPETTNSSDISEESNVDSSNNSSTVEENKEDSISDPDTQEDDSMETSENSLTIDVTGITTLDDLESQIETDLSNAIATLVSEWETLSSEVDTYEKYCENAEKVSDFYGMIIKRTEQMCIMLKEYSAVYTRMVLDSDMSSEDKYKAIDGIEDVIYEDACDEINDEIYEGLLDDMNDHFYEGILEKQPDDVSYSDWYDIISNEYSQWYDTASEVYSFYYDTSSDIYSLYYDLSGDLYQNDNERAEKDYSRFIKKLNKDKGIETENSNSEAIFDTTLREAANVEELENIVEAHVEECIQALQNEWTNLSANYDTYEKYISNSDVIEEFHAHIEDSASQILAMICNYGITYSEFILESDSAAKDKYKDFEGFKDLIYEDACKDVKDEIYEGLLEDIKDYYYEGIIKDAKDSIPYSEWSDARSDAYSWWSDARSEVYSTWSDTRSDIYGYYCDIRSELYSQDLEGANSELEDFKKKVEKM